MSKKRIMLVDDESGFTRLLHLVLPTYDICEVNDPALVLETARKFKPELIFLDVIMPGMDGGTGILPLPVGLTGVLPKT